MFILITVIEPTWNWISGAYNQEFLYACNLYEHLEHCARTCYKSEEHIREGSAERLIKKLINSKHESVLEHASISVRIICSRACSHQLVRHRIAAYSQESQRYCNYGKKGFQVICPPSIGLIPGEYRICSDYQWCRITPVEIPSKAQEWLDVREAEYREYLRELEEGIPPEDARYNLPNACKTEIATTYNLRMWRHIFKERALNKHAQWEIRGIFSSILNVFVKRYPAIFEDLV